MRTLIRRLVRTLPPSAVAGLALATLFLAATVLSTLLSPHGAAAGTSPVPAAASATPEESSPPMPTATSTAVPASTTPARPSPASDDPRALARAPLAGGVLFTTGRGAWRYDGATGSVLRVGATGRPVGDGRQLLVRYDSGGWGLASADGSGGGFEDDVVAPDWVGGGRPMAFLTSDGLTVYAGVRTWHLAVPSASAVRLTADGRRVAVIGHAEAVGDPTLFVADVFVDGSARRLASEPNGAPGHRNDGHFSPDFLPGSWSPDGRYFAWFVVSNSNSINADGVGLRLVDTNTGRITDLGQTVFREADLAWKAPHTLAYTAGGGRETWTNKTLRLWSPEDGVRDVTASNEIGLHPAWSSDGLLLYFIRAASAAYDPLAFFAGTGSGAREIARYDTRTGRVVAVPTRSDVVVEGARPSRDGTVLLAIARPVTRIASFDGLRDAKIPLDLVLIDIATGAITPLARIANAVGFGYYGAYDGPRAMAWSQ